jgi:hypothetical protein
MANPFLGKTTNNRGAIEIPPDDNHAGVLVGLIDLGSRAKTFPGAETRPVREVLLVWELPNARKSGGTLSHVIGKCFTVSYHEKSKLRQTLESWRGQKYPDNYDIDPTKFLGLPCLVNVSHNARGDRTFADVAGVSKLPVGMQPPAATYPPVWWFIGLEDPIPEHSWLPMVFGEKVRDRIERSPEWQEFVAQSRKSTEGPAAAPAAGAVESASEQDQPPY